MCGATVGVEEPLDTALYKAGLLNIVPVIDYYVAYCVDYCVDYCTSSSTV